MKRETPAETIKRLSDPNYLGGNYALPDNAGELEKSKYEICQNIACYKVDYTMMFKYSKGSSYTVYTSYRQQN